MPKPVLHRIELVVVGDELLSGRVTDTNSAFIGRRLSARAIAPQRIVKVRDREAEISDAVIAAVGCAEAVIVVGGLGPTPDDRTLAAVAASLGRELVVHRPTLARIREFFRRRERAMPMLAARQALVPEGAVLFANPCGMVPGMAVVHESSTVVLLPGVPTEMAAIFENGVLPYLARRFRFQRRVAQTVRTFGVPESAIAERGARVFRTHRDVMPAFYPSTAGVDVVLSGARRADVASATDGIVRMLRTAVYEVGEAPLEEVVGRLLTRSGLSLATAESCTGGLVGDRLTNVPGSSAYYVGGVVCYSNDAKSGLLGVSQDTLRRHGAVSAETVREMAAGAARLLAADVGAAVSGIAGPGGGTRAKPVGLVYTCASVRGRAEVECHRFSGTRRMVKERSASAALDLCRRMLQVQA